MKVLITGANGQLGREFCKFFDELGVNYIAADRKKLDITNFENVKDFVDSNPVDFILNCAAYNAVDKAEDEWRKAYLVNGIGVRNLAVAAKKINAAVVHYSTDYVFDGKKETPYTIFDSPNPMSKYGESKLLGENILLESSLNYLVIRVSWVFGVGNTNFLKKLFEWAKERKVLKVVDDQISSPTYTIDLVRATLDLMKNGAYGTYHVTNSDSCSRYEWAKYALSKIQWDGEIIPVKSEEFKTQAKRPNFSVLDNFGTKETIGYDLPEWKDATDRFLKELNF